MHTIMVSQRKVNDDRTCPIGLAVLQLMVSTGGKFTLTSQGYGLITKFEAQLCWGMPAEIKHNLFLFNAFDLYGFQNYLFY